MYRRPAQPATCATATLWSLLAGRPGLDAGPSRSPCAPRAQTTDVRPSRASGKAALRDSPKERSPRARSPHHRPTGTATP